MEVLENLHLEVEEKICQFSVEKLKDLAEYLKMDVSANVEKGRRALARNIREEFDKLVEQHEDRLTYLKETLSYIAGKEQAENGEKNYDVAKKEYEELQLKFSKMVEEQNTLLEIAHKKLEATKSKINETEGSVTPQTVSTNSINYNVEAALRREFRIVGTIGGDSTKDKLTFVGLIRQIDSGLLKGYDDREIIDAVVRAVSSTSKLKAYLEMTSEITLPKLRKILRAHYQEKSGSELYQELTSLVQGQKESPSDFLLRAMSLREKIIFTSQEETGIQYDVSLIRSLFKHSVETGLRDESLRNKLRPVLHITEITDELLMENLNKFVSEENERQLKLSSRNTKPSPSLAQISETTSETDVKIKKAKNDQQSFNLKATLEAVQSELADLKLKVASSNVGIHNNNIANRMNNRRKKPMCKSCEESNAHRCAHCFKCGSKDHFARGCKVSSGNEMSGNERPLSPRDGR